VLISQNCIALSECYLKPHEQLFSYHDKTTRYIFMKWWWCLFCRYHNHVLTSFITYHRVYNKTRVAWRVKQMKQELPTLPVFVFVFSCLSMCYIDQFILFILVIVFAASDYSFDIFKPFLYKTKLIFIVRAYWNNSPHKDILFLLFHSDVWLKQKQQNQLIVFEWTLCQRNEYSWFWLLRISILLHQSIWGVRKRIPRILIVQFTSVTRCFITLQRVIFEFPTHKGNCISCMCVVTAMNTRLILWRFFFLNTISFNIRLKLFHYVVKTYLIQGFIMKIS
jgi:hypothetical protein